MARRPRLVLPGVPLHVIQRGNNRGRCFFGERDYLVYLSMMRNCAHENGCAVHAYVLMTNHVHLLLSPASPESAGMMMKHLGQCYVQYVNRQQARYGTLWQGRFKSCLVGDEHYLLTCQRYIELNPVRAGIASSPGQYRWSSYRSNALGLPDPIITPHATYLSLGRQQLERQAAYSALFEQALSSADIDKLRAASNGNFSFGNDEFTKMAEQALQIKARPSPRGRRRTQ